MKTKPIFITVIIFLLAFAVMTSCNAGDKGVQSPMPTEEPTEKPTEEPTEKPTEEPTEEPTVEPTEDPSAFLDEFTQYTAKTENEQFILDYFNCINRDERRQMYEFFIPRDREIVRSLISDSTNNLWQDRIYELVVTEIKRVDPGLSDPLMNLSRYAYGKNTDDDWEHAPGYLKDMNLVESYLVCAEVYANEFAWTHSSDRIKSGHNDWLITLVYDENEWGLAIDFSVFHISDAMIAYDADELHEMEEFVPPEQ